MKSTGIVRPIDNLGRLVLPKELRRAYELLGDVASNENLHLPELWCKNGKGE